MGNTVEHHDGLLLQNKSDRSRYHGDRIRSSCNSQSLVRSTPHFTEDGSGIFMEFERSILGDLGESDSRRSLGNALPLLDRVVLLLVIAILAVVLILREHQVCVEVTPPGAPADGFHNVWVCQ